MQLKKSSLSLCQQIIETMKKYNLSLIAKLAQLNYSQKEWTFSNWSIAWKQAWSFVKLQMAAKSGEVEVKFKRKTDSRTDPTKKRGDSQIMIGTTNLDLVPTEDHPKEQRPKKFGLQKIYVFGSGWRSFNSYQLEVV